ncbi:MAG: CvpA family protein [Bacteroidota bacterium]
MILDIICLIFVAYGFWVGYSKGIISTVLNLASYVFGILAAMKFGPVMADILSGMINNGDQGVWKGGMFLLGIIVTFFLTLVLFKILARGLTGILESININFINQIAGGILSAAFFLTVFSGLALFGSRAQIITPEARETSITYPILEPLPQFVWERGQALLPVFQDFYDKAAEAMDHLRENVEKDESDSIFDIEE